MAHAHGCWRTGLEANSRLSDFYPRALVACWLDLYRSNLNFLKASGRLHALSVIDHVGLARESAISLSFNPRQRPALQRREMFILRKERSIQREETTHTHKAQKWGLSINTSFSFPREDLLEETLSWTSFTMSISLDKHTCRLFRWPLLCMSFLFPEVIPLPALDYLCSRGSRCHPGPS